LIEKKFARPEYQAARVIQGLKKYDLAT